MSTFLPLAPASRLGDLLINFVWMRLGWSVPSLFWQGFVGWLLIWLVALQNAVFVFLDSIQE